MKTLIVILLALLQSLYSYSQKAEIQYLSGEHTSDNIEWDFFCTSGRKSGEWTRIRVPSCWELEGFGEYNYGHDRNKSSETGIYKTSFTLPERWRGKRIFIVFEGSMTDTKVKVNGTRAGDVHQGAFYRFKREITSLVTWNAENELEVEVSKMSSNKSVNEAERNADFWVFGGIFRPVYLEAQPDNFISYTAVDARHDGTIAMEVSMDKPCTGVEVSVVVSDLKNGKKLGKISKKFKSTTKKFCVEGHIRNVKPWSSESPQLYTAVTTVSSGGKVLSSIDCKIGFRTIDVRERDGVYINGEKIRFKGVNRHCFWPTTGRTVSKEQDVADARLIKEMNMNAVRMSHYPPDKHFLEVCDSIGLYVIDELCAWQYPPYDTPVGTILVNEMLQRDLNHPSVIFWANGNEGGFNFDLDPLFTELDPQKRSVLHPWGISGKINTAHYINYNSGIKNMFNGRDIFMPTELIHGLYDGGHGAGLDDYWNLMLSNPLSAGMFLWDFSDQAVVRTDKGGILDTDRDHGADGILGPYREKEGSFYTIKEIWSPIFVEKKYITPAWDGCFNIENRYHFTDASECRYSFTLARYDGLRGGCTARQYPITAPRIAPGCMGKLSLNLPDDWQEYDFLYLTITDPAGMELFTWSYEIASPERFCIRALGKAADVPAAIVADDGACYTMAANGVVVYIDRHTGLLAKVTADGKTVPLSRGPVLITGSDMRCAGVDVSATGKSVKARYKYSWGADAYRFEWSLSDEGVLRLHYNYRPQDRIEMAGVTFLFPEEGIEGARLLANGPYRVYNNRMKGGSVRLWDKDYNDAITGEVWTYPEFKGYYSHFYAMRLQCPTPFEVYSASEDLILHLFTPRVQTGYDSSRNYTNPPYPEGNISFMDAIPAVGTKFGRAADYGPQSQPHRFKYYSGVRNMDNTVYFKFK